MDKKYAFVLIATAIIVIGMFGASVSQTTAAQPPRVYGLYDANNIYLGDVIDADLLDLGANGNEETYTTYLPAINAFMKFKGAAIAPPIASLVRYTNTDCTGVPYVDEVSSFPSWIVSLESNANNLYMQTDTPTTVTTNSTRFNDQCIIETSTQVHYELIQTNLPFNPNTITSPLELK